MKKSDRKRITVLFLGVWMLVVSLAPVSVRAQVVLNTNANISFGRVDFAATHNGRIQLATNGGVQTTGFGMVSRNDGNAGSVKVTLPNTGILEVKCDDTGRMRGTGASPVNVDIINVEIAVNTGVVFGSGILCDGTKGGDAVVTLLDMDMLVDPDILIGGEVVFVSPTTLPPSKLYSTAGGGGQPITLSIVVQ